MKLINRALVLFTLVVFFLFGSILFVSGYVHDYYDGWDDFEDDYYAPSCAGYGKKPASGQSCCSGYKPCSYGGCNGKCYTSCPNAICKAPNGILCIGNNDCQSGNCRNKICTAPSCTSNAWRCDNFPTICPSTGQRSRTCRLIDTQCSNPNAVKPATTQSCTPSCAGYRQKPASGQSCCSGYNPCLHGGCDGACYSNCPNSLCKASNGVSCDYNSDCQSGNCDGVCKPRCRPGVGCPYGGGCGGTDECGVACTSTYINTPGKCGNPDCGGLNQECCSSSPTCSSGLMCKYDEGDDLSYCIRECPVSERCLGSCKKQRTLTNCDQITVDDDSCTGGCASGQCSGGSCVPVCTSNAWRCDECPSSGKRILNCRLIDTTCSNPKDVNPEALQTCAPCGNEYQECCPRGDSCVSGLECHESELGELIISSICKTRCEPDCSGEQCGQIDPRCGETCPSTDKNTPGKCGNAPAPICVREKGYCTTYDCCGELVCDKSLEIPICINTTKPTEPVKKEEIICGKLNQECCTTGDKCEPGLGLRCREYNLVADLFEDDFESSKCVTAASMPPTGSIKINDDYATTTTTSVTLSLSCSAEGSSCKKMKISNTLDFSYAEQDYKSSIQWGLSPGDGIKAVSVKYKNEEGVWSNIFADNIELKTPKAECHDSDADEEDPFSVKGRVSLFEAYDIFQWGEDYCENSGTLNESICLDDGQTPDTESVDCNCKEGACVSVVTPIQPIPKETIDCGIEGLKCCEKEPKCDYDKGLTCREYDLGLGLFGEEEDDYFQSSSCIKTKSMPPTGTVEINNDDATTTSTAVTLSLTCEPESSCKDIRMEISNRIDFSEPKEADYTQSITDWLLESEGPTNSRAVYVRFKNKDDVWSNIFADTIELDTIELITPTPEPEPQIVEISAVSVSNIGEVEDPGALNLITPWVITRPTTQSLFEDGMNTETYRLLFSFSRLPPSYNVLLQYREKGSDAWHDFRKPVDVSRLDVEGNNVRIPIQPAYHISQSGVYEFRLIGSYLTPSSNNYDAESRPYIDLDLTISPIPIPTEPSCAGLNEECFEIRCCGNLFCDDRGVCIEPIVSEPVVTGSVKINNDDAATTSIEVNLSFSCEPESSCKDIMMQISNTLDIENAAEQDYESSIPWELIPGDGFKMINARFKNKEGVVLGEVFFDTIELKTPKPGPKIIEPSCEDTDTAGIDLGYIDPSTVIGSVFVTDENGVRKLWQKDYCDEDGKGEYLNESICKDEKTPGTKRIDCTCRGGVCVPEALSNCGPELQCGSETCGQYQACQFVGEDEEFNEIKGCRFSAECGATCEVIAKDDPDQYKVRDNSCDTYDDCFDPTYDFGTYSTCGGYLCGGKCTEKSNCGQPCPITNCETYESCIEFGDEFAGISLQCVPTVDCDATCDNARDKYPNRNYKIKENPCGTYESCSVAKDYYDKTYSCESFLGGPIDVPGERFLCSGSCVQLCYRDEDPNTDCYSKPCDSLTGLGVCPTEACTCDNPSFYACTKKCEPVTTTLPFCSTEKSPDTSCYGVSCNFYEDCKPTQECTCDDESFNACIGECSVAKPQCQIPSLECGDTLENGVQMKWRFVGVLGYRLEWREEGLSFDDACTGSNPAECGFTTTADMNANALGLEKNKKYNFRVRAEESQRCRVPGAWSEEVSCSIGASGTFISDKKAYKAGEEAQLTIEATNAKGMEVLLGAAPELFPCEDTVSCSNTWIFPLEFVDTHTFHAWIVGANDESIELEPVTITVNDDNPRCEGTCMDATKCENQFGRVLKGNVCGSYELFVEGARFDTLGVCCSLPSGEPNIDTIFLIEYIKNAFRDELTPLQPGKLSGWSGALISVTSFFEDLSLVYLISKEARISDLRQQLNMYDFIQAGVRRGRSVRDIINQYQIYFKDSGERTFMTDEGREFFDKMFGPIEDAYNKRCEVYQENSGSASIEDQFFCSSLNVRRDIEDLKRREVKLAKEINDPEPLLAALADFDEVTRSGGEGEEQLKGLEKQLNVHLKLAERFEKKKEFGSAGLQYHIVYESTIGAELQEAIARYKEFAEGGTLNEKGQQHIDSKYGGILDKRSEVCDAEDMYWHCHQRSGKRRAINPFRTLKNRETNLILYLANYDEFSEREKHKDDFEKFSELSRAIAAAEQKYTYLAELPAYRTDVTGLLGRPLPADYEGLSRIIENNKKENPMHGSSEARLYHLDSAGHKTFRILYHIGAALTDPTVLIPIPACIVACKALTTFISRSPVGQLAKLGGRGAVKATRATREVVEKKLSEIIGDLPKEELRLLTTKEAKDIYGSVLKKSPVISDPENNLRKVAIGLSNMGVSPDSIKEVLEQSLEQLLRDYSTAVGEVFENYIKKVDILDDNTLSFLRQFELGREAADTVRALEGIGVSRPYIDILLKNSNDFDAFIKYGKISIDDRVILFPETGEFVLRTGPTTTTRFGIPQVERSHRILTNLLDKDSAAWSQLTPKLGIQEQDITSVVAEFLAAGANKHVFKVKVRTPATENVVIVAIPRREGSISVQEFNSLKALEPYGAAPRLLTDQPLFARYNDETRNLILIEEFIPGETASSALASRKYTESEITRLFGEMDGKIWRVTEPEVAGRPAATLPGDPHLSNVKVYEEGGEPVLKYVESGFASPIQFGARLDELHFHWVATVTDEVEALRNYIEGFISQFDDEAAVRSLLRSAKEGPVIAPRNYASTEVFTRSQTVIDVIDEFLASGLRPLPKIPIKLNIIPDIGERGSYLVKEVLGEDNVMFKEVLQNLQFAGQIDNIAVEELGEGAYKKALKVTVAAQDGKESTFVLKYFRLADEAADIAEFNMIRSLEDTGLVQKIYTKEPVLVEYRGAKEMIFLEEFIDGNLLGSFKNTPQFDDALFAYGENIGKIWSATKRTIGGLERGILVENTRFHNTFITRQGDGLAANTIDLSTDTLKEGTLDELIEKEISNLRWQLGADSSQTEAFLRGVTSHLDETGAGKILDDYILRIEDYPIKKPLTGVQRVKILPEGTPDDVSGYAAEINIGRTPDPDTVGRYDQLLRTQRSEPLKPSEFDELKAIEKEYPSIKKWLEPGWEPTDRPLVTTG